MISKSQPFYTDAKVIRCDRCGTTTAVSPADDEATMRAVAARSGWASGPGPRKTTADYCPPCS